MTKKFISRIKRMMVAQYGDEDEARRIEAIQQRRRTQMHRDGELSAQVCQLRETLTNTELDYLTIRALMRQVSGWILQLGEPGCEAVFANVRADMLVAILIRRALAGQRLFARFRRVAAVAAFLAIGWFAHAELAPLGVGNSIASPKPPAFVDDALMSHRTAQLRAGLHSFHAVVDYDREELGTATGIALPDLPRDWTIRDVQLVPASSGPSVEVELAAGRAGSMSLYAVRSDAFRVINPTPLRKGDEAVVYWQMGEHAYALTGGSTAAETIAQAAEQLAASLH